MNLTMTNNYQMLEEPLLDINLEWENITLTADKNKQILKSVFGYANSGELTAILGPSGSGKTSLLNVLACRTLYSKNLMLTGKCYINGNIRNEYNFKQIIGYVTQEDSLFSFLTVYETLYLGTCFFSSDLTKNEKSDLILDIINQLNLSKVMDTIVGDYLNKGLSGGEKKRLSIGLELISQPKLILLDEPTSGLDSFQALSVINTLEELTRDGITIIMSIHQPSSNIMNLIHSIILISEGHTVYCGPTDRAQTYFSDIGFEMKDNFNPADFYLDLIAVNYTSTELLINSRERLNYLVEKWRENIVVKTGYHSMESYLIFDDNNNKNSLSLIKYLGWRSIKQSSRNTFALKIKIFTNIFFALVLGGIYSNSNSVQDIIGVLFFIAINQSFGNTMGIINIFIHEKQIIQKEIDSNAYNLLPYYITKIITEIPFTIVPPLLFGIINYWVVGLYPDGWRFLIFLLQIIVESITAMSMGIFISSISSSIEIATTIAPILNILFFLFAGVFININSLPKVLRFFPYISFIKWSFQALVLNQYKGNEEVLEIYCHENRSISNSIGFVALIGLSFLVFGYIGLLFGKQKYIFLI